jgi:hypothetical protein
MGDDTSVDPVVLLERSRTYAEGLDRIRRRGHGDSHPEQAIRVYALWLFSESDVYRELTGLGPGTRPIADVDRTLGRLVGPAESADDMGLPPDAEPCLVDRALGALAVARERARGTVAAAVRSLAGSVQGASSACAADPEDEMRSHLAELEHDPLEERFAELERLDSARTEPA